MDHRQYTGSKPIFLRTTSFETISRRGGVLEESEDHMSPETPGELIVVVVKRKIESQRRL